jgi:PEP-CTERM motif
MIFANRYAAFAALAMSAALFGTAAEAAPMVTYTWTTTSEGFGPHVSAPSSATFEVPLSDVLAGAIPQSDISNIELTYPGLTFDSSVTSSIGLDFTAFVDPTTGTFVFHDDTQGLAVIAFAGTDINAATTFLSITVDNPVSGSVADQFNALNDGAAYAGFPTAGFWTASFPVLTPVPEPSTWVMMLLGFSALGFGGYRASRRIAAQRDRGSISG